MHHKRINLASRSSPLALSLAASLAWPCAPARPRPAGPKPRRPAVRPAPAPAAGRQARGEPPQEPPTEAERLIDRPSRRSPASSRSRPTWSRTSRCSSRSSTIKGRYLKAPVLAHLPQADRHRPARLAGHDAPGLRRRDALGLPADPRVPDLPQDEHQAGLRAAELARHRRQDPRPGHDADRLRRPGGPAGRPPQVDQVRPEGRGRARRQARLDPPRHLAEPQRAGRARPAAAARRPARCPPYVPSLATLYLGKEDGWPYKIDPGRQGPHDPPGHPADRPRRPPDRLARARSRRSSRARSS